MNLEIAFRQAERAICDHHQNTAYDFCRNDHGTCPCSDFLWKRRHPRFRIRDISWIVMWGLIVFLFWQGAAELGLGERPVTLSSLLRQAREMSYEGGLS